MERNVVMIALFAALIAVLGLIPKIQLGFGVPITAQSMGVMLCGTILGARDLVPGGADGQLRRVDDDGFWRGHSLRS